VTGLQSAQIKVPIEKRDVDLADRRRAAARHAQRAEAGQDASAIRTRGHDQAAA
jgi:hypothetical protein